MIVVKVVKCINIPHQSGDKADCYVKVRLVGVRKGGDKKKGKAKTIKTAHVNDSANPEYNHQDFFAT